MTSRMRGEERRVRTKKGKLGPFEVAALLGKRFGALGRPPPASIERVQGLLASMERVVLELLLRGLASQLAGRDAEAPRRHLLSSQAQFKHLAAKFTTSKCLVKVEALLQNGQNINKES